MMGRGRSATTTSRRCALRGVPNLPALDGPHDSPRRCQSARFLKSDITSSPSGVAPNGEAFGVTAPSSPNHKFIAMEDGKWIDRYGRRPETNWIREALNEIEHEAPGLLQEATLAMTELAKWRGDGGRMPG